MLRALFLSLLCVSAASAQIAVPEVSPPHKQIIAATEGKLPSGAKGATYLWEGSAGVDLDPEEVDGKRLHVVAPPGQHSLTLYVAYVLNDKAAFAKHSAEFSVGDKPVPVSTLLDLIDPAAAKAFSQYHRDFAAAVRAGDSTTLVKFKTAYLAAMSSLKTDITRVKPALEKRIDSLGGDAPLDMPLRVRLAALLDKIANEFDSTPIVPEVIPGKRNVVILYETEQQALDWGFLFTELRAGPSAKALADAGNELLILDDDLRPELTDIPPPAMYVFDSNKNVVSKGPMPTTPQAVLEAIK
jgi:hypothetical protein